MIKETKFLKFVPGQKGTASGEAVDCIGVYSKADTLLGDITFSPSCGEFVFTGINKPECILNLDYLKDIISFLAERTEWAKTQGV